MSTHAKWTAHKINVRDWCVMSDDPKQPIHVTVEQAFGETPGDVAGRARLIAAAPELLAELTVIVDHATKYGAAPRSAEKMFDRARAAIAKAEGK